MTTQQLQEALRDVVGLVAHDCTLEALVTLEIIIARVGAESPVGARD